jgi:hypothetical protein
MNTAWSHLPNATAIDRIIADVKTNDTAWSRARSQAWDAAWDAARSQAWDAAWDAVGDAVDDAAWLAAMDAVGDAVDDAAWLAAMDAAWGAILALIAWDDCRYLLDNDPKHVHLLALLGQPAAILLLPAVIALNKGDR